MESESVMKIELSNTAIMNGELALAWSDGEETYLSFQKLRESCPCAACQGEPDVTGQVIRPQVSFQKNSFDLVSCEVVGGYALQCRWADGHSTGIYSFEYLRKLD